MDGYTYRIEQRKENVAFTVFSPSHGECGVPDSRTGFGINISEAYHNCEWNDKIEIPEEVVDCEFELDCSKEDDEYDETVENIFE